jgi:hypothetical protein
MIAIVVRFCLASSSLFPIAITAKSHSEVAVLNLNIL